MHIFETKIALDFHSNCILYTVRCGSYAIAIVLSLEGCERSQLLLAEVEMESYGLPKSHPKSTTEPQYEDCGGGVISSNVAMEENPAYHSVDVAAAKPWIQSSIEIQLCVMTTDA